MNRIEYDFDDHPSEKGTLQIVQQIEEAVGEKIILQPESDVTTTRKYSQVKALYKVGCRGCNTREFTSYLCAECKQASTMVDITYLQDIITKLEKDSFPNLNEIDMTDINEENEEEMSDIKKRQRDGSDGENENAKTPRSDTH